MALIKCTECGKEFSDKAGACPSCACPVDKMDKSLEVEVKPEIKKEVNSKEEIELDRTIIDKAKIGILVGFFVFMILIMILLSLSIGMIQITLFPWFIYLIIGIKISNYYKNFIILTNKRIKGKIYRLLGSIEIDIPIDKVNAIFTTKNMGISGLSISSAFAKTYHLIFIKNASEFREKTMNMIDNK